MTTQSDSQTDSFKGQEFGPYGKFFCEVGDIVQIDPNHPEINKAFGGCLLIVTSVYEWGVQGYVQSLGTRESIGGEAHYRANWAQLSPTGGKVVWARSEDEGPEYDA
jgi:hypothetical protein